MIWKIRVCFYMNLFQHPLERLACFLLYVTVGSSSVLEYPSSSWLICKSFEMQGNCHSFRLIDHLAFLQIYSNKFLSCWSVYSLWSCLICVIIISFTGNYRWDFLLIIFVIIKLVVWCLYLGVSVVWFSSLSWF